jgi:hypothetical protein
MFPMRRCQRGRTVLPDGNSALKSGGEPVMHIGAIDKALDVESRSLLYL